VLAGGAVDRLYAIARFILRDAELAEDATQEALGSPRHRRISRIRLTMVSEAIGRLTFDLIRPRICE